MLLFTHNVIGNHRCEPLAYQNEILLKGTKIIGKEKTFGGKYSKCSLIFPLFLGKFIKKQYICGNHQSS